MMFSSRIAATLALLLVAQQSEAGAAENPATVAAAVRQAALGIAPPSSAIRLGPVSGAAVMPACSAPLAVAFSGVAPYEQAAAHCPDQGWTLYVTVTLTQTAPVEIAARPVAAGQVFGAGDIALMPEPTTLYAGRQVFYDPAQLLGASAMMSLAAGSIITAADISEPEIVQSGQTLTVEVLSGSVQLSITAIADEAGRVGDTILLTNPSSGRRFSALVTSGGPVLRLQP
jgi:flagella basal body P-ring formation protein FlgA